MNNKLNLHPSIIAALNGQKYEPQETDVTFDDGETLTVERFTFGNEEPTLLVAIRAIIELSENSELSNEFFFEADEALNYVSKRLSITNEQSLMLSLVISDFANQHIDVTDFGRHLRCTPITLLPFLKEMDVLEERGYIVCNHSGHRPTYRIPYYILEALNDNKVPEMNQPAGLTCEELINELDKIFDQRSEHELTYDGLTNRAKSLLGSNSELHFVEQIDSYGLNVNDRIVLLFIACQFVLLHDEHIVMPQLSRLFDSRSLWCNIRQQLQKEKNRLQQLGLIEFAHDGGFGDRNAFCLTMTAKRALFTELDIKLANDDQQRRGLQHHDDITARQLFYDEATSRQVDELSRLLSEDNYQQIRQRLQDKGFRCGFTCLFYGSPGTGKTETVLQLARQTGRDIMQVNVSEIKSKWVGDSEKNVKALFDDYRSKVKNCEVTPILLFNEADAIINRRQEMAERSKIGEKPTPSLKRTGGEVTWLYRMAFLFGFFQAMMPLLGWLGIIHFETYTETYDHWIAFGLLAFIGGKMVWESFGDEEEQHFNPRRLHTQLLLAVATSIDALAVGISFACTGYTVLSQLTLPLMMIGVVSFLFSIMGYHLGRHFGRTITKKMKPELIGGLILIAIGLKILLL